jgi:malonate decarboxylase beta subunit
MCCSIVSPPSAALGPLAPVERIAAIADPGSVASVNAALAAQRPSPHLARWGITPQEDDGVAVARATIGGAPVLIAAQDERFLGGSAGANHAGALQDLFRVALAERPAAVLLLCASGGVRLHEANPAELGLARALAALLDLRAAGVRVLSLCVGDVFGGAAVLACAADRIALVPTARLGLSGPKVIEEIHGKAEMDSADRAAVDTLFGAVARAAAGHVELIADDTAVARAWIALGGASSAPFVTRIRAAHDNLGARLAATDAFVAAGRERASVAPPVVPLPRALSSLYAALVPVDGNGWLWQMPGAPVWFTRASGLGTLGPREAHAFDAALLAHLVDRGDREHARLFVVSDSAGHESTRGAEAVCVAQYLAQHAAVLALLRMQGVRVFGLLTGNGRGAAFFANGLQSSKVFALPSARVTAMEPSVVARVTGLDAERLRELTDDDPLLGTPARHFAAWGGIAATLPDLAPARLAELV